MNIDQQSFLKKYGIEDKFYQSKLSWDLLMQIAKDYEAKAHIFQEIAVDYVNQLNELPQVHSVRYRLKDVEHLIEKIIRKAVEYEDVNIVYNIDTYLVEITDIIGIRALYVFKSDYLPLHNAIIKRYKKNFCEKPQVKLREGDDKSLYEGLRNVEFQIDSMYRSIHYTIRAVKGEVIVPIEIQTRSIFEEGWSEINHKLLYKKNNLSFDQEILLKQASSILSSLAGDCDTLGELMMHIVNKEDDVDFVTDCNRTNGSSILEELIRR
ncbi:MAG: RelA/SpoT domain-containing protein [Lachnospiraceae bacterium]|nr:RelA/SpoT domain-containing protein [Lachnospiraceae bacterium]